MGAENLHAMVEDFADKWGPRRPSRYLQFVGDLRVLLEAYGRAALRHESLPDTEHAHGDLAQEETMDAEHEAERLRKNIAALLKSVGRKRPCRGATCKAELYMVKHLNGVDTPYDEDGTNHFATCPDRADFRKERKRNHESATPNNPAAAV